MLMAFLMQSLGKFDIVKVAFDLVLKSYNGK